MFDKLHVLGMNDDLWDSIVESDEFLHFSPL